VNPYLRSSGKFVGAALAVLPRRLRFRAALFAARRAWRLLGPVLKTQPFHRPVSSGSGPDEVLRALLRGMVRVSTEFDPVLRYDGPEDFVDALRRGPLLVTGHFPLNSLFARYAHDHGADLLSVQGQEVREVIWGTGHPLQQVVMSPGIMLKMRSALADAQPVVLAIDRTRPGEGTVPVETAFGTRYVMTPVFKLAKRLQVPMYFFCVRMEGGAPLLVVRPIEPSVEVFARHLHEQTLAIRDRASIR